MKKKAIFISILVMAFLFVGVVILGSQPVYAKAKLLRLVVPKPPGDWPLTFTSDELARKFNERTKGKEYVMEVHAGGALAKLPEYFDAVRIGAVELACAPWAMFSFLDPRLGIKETPFLFASSRRSVGRRPAPALSATDGLRGAARRRPRPAPSHGAPMNRPDTGCSMSPQEHGLPRPR